MPCAVCTYSYIRANFEVLHRALIAIRLISPTKIFNGVVVTITTHTHPVTCSFISTRMNEVPLITYHSHVEHFASDTFSPTDWCEEAAKSCKTISGFKSTTISTSFSIHNRKYLRVCDNVSDTSTFFHFYSGVQFISCTGNCRWHR